MIKGITILIGITLNQLCFGQSLLKENFEGDAPSTWVVYADISEHYGSEYNRETFGLVDVVARETSASTIGATVYQEVGVCEESVKCIYTFFQK